MICLFLISTTFMAFKPLLLHLTARGDRAHEHYQPLPPAFFQLAVEASKICICCVVSMGRKAWGRDAQLWAGTRHTLGFLPPALVYLVMNVLTVHAARMMPPPTFQLLANLKIIFTAIAAHIFMKKRVACAQWCALSLLTVGVALGQMEESGRVTRGFSSVGVLLMTLNSALSATGGVLTESVLKGGRSANLSIWATNLHMALHSLVGNLIFVLAFPDDTFHSWWAKARGAGVDAVLVITMINEAMNGIVLSLLVRRLDSIAKNYAFSASVFVTGGFSALVLGYRPPLSFYAGAAVTLFSSGLYAHTAIAVPSRVEKTD